MQLCSYAVMQLCRSEMEIPTEASGQLSSHVEVKRRSSDETSFVRAGPTAASGQFCSFAVILFCNCAIVQFCKYAIMSFALTPSCRHAFTSFLTHPQPLQGGEPCGLVPSSVPALRDFVTSLLNFRLRSSVFRPFKSDILLSLHQ